ncbi:phosphoribosylglycinamide formyltransferase [Oceanospirillum sediminis]|uniref:Phosphoribosylglycinamide formyltransferase n=1 Tax=Oceanospirillum sediminis TaxID=2760088 RepID=A0A839ISW4_9GAMM|nr:phosphoribosylglycinamide formyltransferase [Oceanospirillum sediminis]MBB1488041.1 phosphoribosylglycinamide formyltransferase [Oceanospirillum sediminis]
MSGSIVVLISGSGSNLQAIIDSVKAGDIPGQISAVISNKENAYGLQRAEQADIPTRVLDHTEFANREIFDANMIRLIDEYQPDLVVLSGFMRILTADFVRRYAGKLINIHPSLLPKYQGLHTHKRAIEAGDSTHGASVHFVTEELDGGPVFIQASVPVEQDDTPETLAARVLVQEHKIYPIAVKWFMEGRIQLQDNIPHLDGVSLAGNIPLLSA